MSKRIIQATLLMSTLTEPRIFPPHNNRDLKHLHQAIIASTATEDQKQSFLYYILKCVDPPSRGVELADDFASELIISRRSTALMEGIWQLDHLHYRVSNTSPFC
jgi:hypothetical protein